MKIFYFWLKGNEENPQEISIKLINFKSTDQIQLKSEYVSHQENQQVD
jgi:hypothetical protein